MDNLILSFEKKADNAGKLTKFLYQNPIISVSDIAKSLGVSKPTANSLIKDFENKGILTEITGHERNKRFVFRKYLNIYSKV